jgi:hypothetical protein
MRSRKKWRSSIAGRMEKAGRAGQFEEIAVLLPELERHFDLLRAKMREETT